MQRINTAYFYRLAANLVPLRSLVANSDLYFDGYTTLRTAREELRFFLRNELIPPITSFANCRALFELIGKIVDEEYVEDRKFQWGEVSSIAEALNHFEISLQSDFGMRDTFIVSPKAAYSTTLLAESGETVLTEAVHELVPSLKKDIQDGCRCLAFELPTASAFHFFRAVEAMVKAYGEFVRGKSFTEQEKKGGLGSYANLLKEKSLKVDRRVFNSIEQLASLHRNPTMHPEMHISKTEIMATLGMVVSLIETLAIDWIRLKTTPETPLIDILPDDSKVIALLEDVNEEKFAPEIKEARSSDAADILRLEREIASTDSCVKKADQRVGA